MKKKMKTFGIRLILLYIESMKPLNTGPSHFLKHCPLFRGFSLSKVCSKKKKNFRYLKM
jgi:hypothetical protein